MEHILFSVENAVARLTFNRPEVFNSMNQAMRQEILEVLATCEKNSDIRAVYITGSGKAFCAGEDLQEDAAAGRAVDEDGAVRKAADVLAVAGQALLQHGVVGGGRRVEEGDAGGGEAVDAGVDVVGRKGDVLESTLAEAWWRGRRSVYEGVPKTEATGPELVRRCKADIAELFAPECGEDHEVGSRPNYCFACLSEQRDRLLAALKLARTHYENFPVLAPLVGDRRDELALVYAFCRTTDDLGDELPGDRLAALDRWEAMFRRALDGDPPADPPGSPGHDHVLALEPLHARTLSQGLGRQSTVNRCTPCLRRRGSGARPRGKAHEAPTADGRARRVRGGPGGMFR